MTDIKYKMWKQKLKNLKDLAESAEKVCKSLERVASVRHRIKKEV